jgi:hypothetical protein
MNLKVSQILAVVVGLSLWAGCRSPTTYELDTSAQVRDPMEAADLSDGRARYRQIFCERIEARSSSDSSCEAFLNRLADEPRPDTNKPEQRLARAQLRVFIIPGFMGDKAPGGMMPFGASLETLRSGGFQIDYLQVSGGGSSDYNAGQIAEQLGPVELQADERLVLIGYSKGVVDLLHFLVNHPEQGRRVDAVVSIAGAVKGTPLAEEIPDKLIKTFGKLGSGDMGDAEGLKSLRQSVQLEWLAQHSLPSGPQYFSLGSFTDRKNISSIMLGLYDRLAKIELRNDGQTIYYDQLVPGSTLLGWANGDHWAVALPFQEQSKYFAATLMERNRFPRTELLEATLIYLQEALASD